MPVGKSGRIVVEIDRKVKIELHSILEKEEKTLKSWFLENVNQYLAGRSQNTLFDDDEKGA
jgi:hypothetical protein